MSEKIPYQSSNCAGGKNSYRLLIEEACPRRIVDQSQNLVNSMQ